MGFQDSSIMEHSYVKFSDPIAESVFGISCGRKGTDRHTQTNAGETVPRDCRKYHFVRQIAQYGRVSFMMFSIIVRRGCQSAGELIRSGPT